MKWWSKRKGVAEEEEEDIFNNDSFKHVDDSANNVGDFHDEEEGI